jgi:hypothetical protein
VLCCVPNAMESSESCCALSQAAHAQLTVERDHHKREAKREAASAAASMAEAAQLRAALAKKGAESKSTEELAALQASLAQALRERDHHAEAAKREAASAAASDAEAAGLRDALAQKHAAHEGSHASLAQEVDALKVSYAVVAFDSAAFAPL